MKASNETKAKLKLVLYELWRNGRDGEDRYITVETALDLVEAEIAAATVKAHKEVLRKLQQSIERIEDAGTDTGMSWWVAERLNELQPTTQSDTPPLKHNQILKKGA